MPSGGGQAGQTLGLVRYVKIVKTELVNLPLCAAYEACILQRALRQAQGVAFAILGRSHDEDVPNEKPDKEMVDLAVELIERKSGPFKPDEFVDHYHSALKELVDKKMRKPHRAAVLSI